MEQKTQPNPPHEKEATGAKRCLRMDAGGKDFEKERQYLAPKMLNAWEMSKAMSLVWNISRCERAYFASNLA